MNLISFVSKRAVILLSLLCVFACVASADTVYNVSGTFGPGTADYTGPLNSGTFSGTFTATLPVTSTVYLTTFDIDLNNSSGTTLFNLTNLNATGVVLDDVVGCATTLTTTGTCDEFLFRNGTATDFLQLATPLSFTGGAVIPGFNAGEASTSWGGTTFDAGSLVASGSITAAPVSASEPPLPLIIVADFLLFGLALEFLRRRGVLTLNSM